jgi:acyl dehydratase
VKLGDHAALKRAFSAEDVREYEALSGAAATRARVPEPLIGALFSRLLGMELPGPATNYLKQETRWHSDAGVGETLTARVEITRIRPDKHLVDLATACSGEDGRRIASGRALVYVADVGKAATDA